ETGTLFAGDMVAGEGTVVIAPPDGDMRAYLDSLRRLRDLRPALILPAHGPPLADAGAVLTHYIEHRLQREEQVLRALRDRPEGTTAEGILPVVYSDVDPVMHPVAILSLTAHLEKLVAEGRVVAGAAGYRLVRS